MILFLYPYFARYLLKIMKKRTLAFSCSDKSCQYLATIIKHYAYAAFPIGGSECAQATRESLVDMASRLDSTLETKIAINRRQVPMLKSAIKWYFAEVKQDEVLKEHLLQQLQRPKRSPKT